MRNGTAGPAMPATGRAPLCWTVIAVDGAGHGHGYCGHAHATADEATACPWDPPRPVVCDLLVRQVRAEIFDRPLGPVRPAPGQLELWRAE
jgi:hypothetical protein